MYLKKVIIKGFKSFADKMTLDFGSGVTAVVGPNGCGKSNISDSVRWVIGEHNARNLRGLRMGDLVFAGTETRPGASMAEVSLYLDNSDGVFNLPYQEICITRRLYKDGETECLINHNPCRLKDIAELFMDTGIGTTSYSLLEQGKVDHILRARPIERRAIFEEAAGITKYKVRKEEALRRLKRTETDIVRLNDIIKELDHQVKSLKRQAGIAMRYRRLKEELTTADIALMAKESDRLKLELAQVTEARDGARTNVESTTTDLAARKADRDSINSQLALIQARIRDIHEERIKLRAEIEKGEARLNHLGERKNDLDHQKGLILDEIREGDIRFEVLRERIEEHGGKCRVLAEEIARLREEKAKVYDALKEKTKDRTREESRIREINSSVLRLQNEISARENDLRRIERDIHVTERTLERLTLEEQVTNTELANQKAKIDAKKDSLELVEKEQKSLGEQLKIDAGELAAYESSLNEKNRALAGVESEIQGKQAHLRSLETLQKSYEGYASGTQRLLKLRQKNDPICSRISTSVAEVISVKPEFEHAFEVALAADLQALVTDNKEDAFSLLNWLHDKEEGRATFVSVQFLSEKKFSAVAEGALPEGSSWAMDHVITEARFEPLAKALFGDLCIVPDIGTAATLSANGLGACRFVTRTGDLFDSHGRWTGGSGTGTGLLSRRREIDALQREIGDLTSKKELMRTDLSETESTVAGLRKRIEETKAKIHEREIAATALREECAALGRERDRLERSLKTISTEMQANEPVLQKLRAGSETTNASLTDLRSRFAGLEEQRGVAEADLRKVVDDTQQWRESEQRLSLALMEKEKDLERIQDVIDAAGKERESLVKAREDRKNRIENLEKRKEEAGEEETSIKERITGLYKDADVLDVKVQKEEDDLRKAAEILDAATKAVDVAEKSLAKEKERLEKLELSRYKLELSEQNLARRAHDEYQKTLEECTTLSVGEARDEDTLRAEADDIRQRIMRIGSVNELAIEECDEVEKRFDFMTKERDDLDGARKRLLKTIAEINKTTRTRFETTFEEIRKNFQAIYRKVFGGGRADLLMLTGEGVDPNEAGVAIVVQPPGKNLQSIELLSGGEKAMTAVVLLFAIYQTKPSPFCILDEIDAPLDDTNVGRFCNLVRDFTDRSQFIIITHNKVTMEMSDVIYGVTMEQKGVSNIVSIQFDRSGRPNVERIETVPEPQLVEVETA